MSVRSFRMNQNQAVPWVFGGTPGMQFYSSERGLCQRLRNGNTLVVNSEENEMIEATAAQEIVWSCTLDSYLTTARRYSREELTFLDGDVQARP